MADQATERATINASPERCFEVATAFERYPEWARDVKEATVLERDAEGRGIKVQYRAAAMGRSARYVLDYDYSKAPVEMSWTLAEGDIMRRLDGRYVFEPAAKGDGGPNVAEVTYHLAVELIVPIPGFVKRRAESKIMGTALSELKKRVEALEG